MVLDTVGSGSTSTLAIARRMKRKSRREDSELRRRADALSFMTTTMSTTKRKSCLSCTTSHDPPGDPTARTRTLLAPFCERYHADSRRRTFGDLVLLLVLLLGMAGRGECNALRRAEVFGGVPSTSTSSRGEYRYESPPRASELAETVTVTSSIQDIIPSSEVKARKLTKKCQRKHCKRRRRRRKQEQRQVRKKRNQIRRRRKKREQKKQLRADAQNDAPSTSDPSFLQPTGSKNQSDGPTDSLPPPPINGGIGAKPQWRCTSNADVAITSDQCSQPDCFDYDATTGQSTNVNCAAGEECIGAGACQLAPPTFPPGVGGWPEGLQLAPAGGGPNMPGSAARSAGNAGGGEDSDSHRLRPHVCGFG